MNEDIVTDNAKTVARIVNLIAVLLIIWLLFSRFAFGISMYNIAVITVLLFPAIPLMVLVKYKNVVTILKGKTTYRYPVGTALFGPPLVLSILTLINYFLIDYYLCTIYIIVVLLFFCYLYSKILPVSGSETIKYGFIIAALFMLPYCHSLVVILNCEYDTSKVQQYPVVVLNKYKINGKYSKSYNLILDSWGTKPKGNEIRVSSRTYNLAVSGDKINIHLKQGLLGMPWYTIY